MSTLNSTSIVICTYAIGRFNNVTECVDSLRKQHPPPDEIILAVDPDKALRKFYSDRLGRDVRIVSAEDYGLSHARNSGIKAACGDIVAFIDDDATADRIWLKSLIRNFADPHVMGVGGYAVPIWEEGRPAWFPEDLDWVVGCSYKGLPEQKAIVRNPIGCNMAFRRSVFDSIGYFKPSMGRVGKTLLAGEEAEFSLRVLAGIAGSKIVFDPEAVVYHRVPKHRARLSYMVKRSFYEGISKAMATNSASSSFNELSTEAGYLSHLFGKAIPAKLKGISNPAESSQLAALALSTWSVFWGYACGRIATTLGR